MDLLNNPWVVGIGGGVLSGGLVTLVSRYVMGKRENREYLQKVLIANRELVYAMRPGISENVVPSREVVIALVHSTARKHGVAKEDLFSPAEIGEELVKEVMDSSFLSAAKKSEHCALLDPLIKPYVLGPTSATGAQAAAADVGEVKAQTLSEYRQRLTSMMSMMMGVLTALMTLLVVLLRVGDSFIPMRLEVLLPMVVALGTLLLSMFSFMLLRLRSTQRSKKDAGGEEERSDPKTEKPKTGAP